jgi:RNA recognition motif-containing protein
MPSQFHEDPHHPSHFYDLYFISQLVLHATEHDVRKFLRKYVGVPKVKQVVFLKDKRTGKHKGCSYIELGKLSDVKKELNMMEKYRLFNGSQF